MMSGWYINIYLHVRKNPRDHSPRTGFYCLKLARKIFPFVSPRIIMGRGCVPHKVYHDCRVSRSGREPKLNFLKNIGLRSSTAKTPQKACRPSRWSRWQCQTYFWHVTEGTQLVWQRYTPRLQTARRKQKLFVLLSSSLSRTLSLARFLSARGRKSCENDNKCRLLRKWERKSSFVKINVWMRVLTVSCVCILQGIDLFRKKKIISVCACRVYLKCVTGVMPKRHSLNFLKKLNEHLPLEWCWAG